MSFHDCKSIQRDRLLEAHNEDVSNLPSSLWFDGVREVKLHWVSCFTSKVPGEETYSVVLDLGEFMFVLHELFFSRTLSVVS